MIKSINFVIAHQVIFLAKFFKVLLVEQASWHWRSYLDWLVKLEQYFISDELSQKC